MKIAPYLLIGLGIGFGVAVLTSCAHEESITQIEYPMALDEAQRDIKQGQFIRAETRIKEYLNNPQNINWQGQAYILLGESREASDNLAGALDSYKKAISQGAGYDNTVMVKGLYRISWIYEKLERYEDLLTLLLDLERNLSGKDYFIKYIENPSRLANTYFVLGKWDKALEQRALVKQETLSGPTAQAFAKSEPLRFYQAQLYRSFAGINFIRPKNILASQVLPRVQKDLLDTAELALPKQSEAALKYIYNLYQEEWTPLRVKKTFTKIEDRLNYNRGKLDQLALFMDQIQELKGARRPASLTANPVLIADFFKKMEIIEKEVRAYVASLELGVQKSSGKK